MGLNIYGLVTIFALILFIVGCGSVDQSQFMTCSQSGFCKRNRALNKVKIDPEAPSYGIVPESCQLRESVLKCDIVDHKRKDVEERMVFTLTVLEDMSFRVLVDDTKEEPKRFHVQDVVQLPLKEMEIDQGASVKTADSYLLVVPFNKAVVKVEILFKSFIVKFFRDSEHILTLNKKQLFNFERGHLPVSPEELVPAEVDAPEEGENKEEENSEQGVNEGEESPEGEKEEKEEIDPDLTASMGEEQFKHFRDSKPKGPTSVGIDVEFVGAKNVYGIPEHAVRFDLPHTKGSKASSPGDPYRLYNLDVFEYELDKTMALYASIPYMIGRRSVDGTFSGMLFLNAAEMWVDVWDGEEENGESTHTHWMAESGVVDVFIFLGPSPYDVFKQYSSITGVTPLPPQPAISYHQCRWNYNDEEDVQSLTANFDKYDIPADFFWLDIEHTDGKKYFTWDSGKFPDPIRMQKDVAAKGRFMVTIIDPHIKRESGYHIHGEAEAQGLYVKDKSGGTFSGNCWPGSSSYLDFLEPSVRSWWADKFAFDQYKGSSETLYTWNDMNEPSVFDGPEISMPRDNIHANGWEHRDIHNIYGMYLPMSTVEGQRRRSNFQKRPFVLSRSGFAGSQKYGAIWTGDNKADWGHLEYSIPMLLSFSVAGVPFIGADVGGFFGNPDSKLLVRWYQTGSFQPFFRAHAHLDTRRREPWLLPDEDMILVRAAIRRRYELLPLWYTLFFEHYVMGRPVMRPLWAEFTKDVTSASIDSQYMIGDALLVAPVLKPDVLSHEVYFPGAEDVWYDQTTWESHSGGWHTFAVTMSSVPVFQRGGTIIARKLRVRRASSLMKNDPYTLFIGLDKAGSSAEGSLYLDDRMSMDYQLGVFAYMKYKLDGNALTSRMEKELPITALGTYESEELVQSCVILGVKQSPRRITITTGGGAERDLSFVYDSVLQKLTVKKLDAQAVSEWSMKLVMD
eukprot:Nk52_evm34s1671 gene=Nk52_evmTU34s1671